MRGHRPPRLSGAVILSVASTAVIGLPRENENQSYRHHTIGKLDMQNKDLLLEYVDTEVTVRYAETDQMGVVYYANYLVWFEVGRGAWCRAKGFHYRDMEEQDHRLLMVAEATCRYKYPARYEDEIVIRTAVASASDAVIRFQYEIRNKNSGQLLATGATAHVFTDTAFRPARIPDRYRTYFNLRPRKS